VRPWEVLSAMPRRHQLEPPPGHRGLPAAGWRLRTSLWYAKEALDDFRYEEWLDLLTDDVRYWMPI